MKTTIKTTYLSIEKDLGGVCRYNYALLSNSNLYKATVILNTHNFSYDAMVSGNDLSKSDQLNLITSLGLDADAIRRHKGN